MSLTALLTLLLAKRLPAWPSSMVAMVVTAGLAWALDLGQFGIATLGAIGSGLPAFQMPGFPGLMRELVLPALNLAMVSFVSMMLTAQLRRQERLRTDADKEFRASAWPTWRRQPPGLCHQRRGFAHRGQRQRRQEPAGLHHRRRRHRPGHLLPDGAAATYPTAALGVVLVMAFCPSPTFAACGRCAIRSLRLLAGAHHLHQRAGHGVISGITLAVLLGLFQFLRNVMRPTDQLLGMDDEGVVRTLVTTSRPGHSRHPGLSLQLAAHLLQRPLLQAAVLALLVRGSPVPNAWWWMRWPASPIRTSA